ncbi:MAG: hypothetical protein HYX72_04095 [Acidobacteria bacterium]|nr:hypothetical protein [Acidobacteriota bacterium]
MSDIFERIADAQLRAELRKSSTLEENYWPRDMMDLMGLTSPFFMASRLDSYCHNFDNRFGRFAACSAAAREFPGRCEAYRLAMEADSEGIKAKILSDWLESCTSRAEYLIQHRRDHNWPDWLQFDGWRDTPERRRMTMRLYTSAMDPDVRKAACEDAAQMPEARDIPECADASDPRLP